MCIHVVFVSIYLVIIKINWNQVDQLESGNFLKAGILKNSPSQREF